MTSQQTMPVIGQTVDRNHVAYLVEAARTASAKWHDGRRNRQAYTDPNPQFAGQDLADAAHQGASYWRKRHVPDEESGIQEEPFTYWHPGETSFKWEPVEIAHAIQIYEFIAGQDPRYPQTPAFGLVQAIKDALITHMARPPIDMNDWKVPKITE